MPVYLLIALGYLSVRTEYIAGEAVSALSRFTLRICLPALIFSAVALSGQEQPLDVGIGLVYLAASLVAVGTGVVATRSLSGALPSGSWILGLGSGVSNSGFMGYPISALLLGQEASARFFAVAVIAENVALLPFGIIAADLARTRGGDLRTLIANAIALAGRNPLLTSVLFGLAVRLSGLTVPHPAARAVGMLADVAPAVALFVVGATLARYPLERSGGPAAALVVGCKLLLHPALVALAIALMPGATSDLAGIAVLFAAMPMISIFPILGEPFGIDRLCATALVLAVTASIASIALWAAVVRI